MLTPLSKTAWAELSEKAKWDCLVALRGPDLHNSEIIKWFTTSVIRGKLRKVMRVGGLINETLNLIILPTTSGSALPYKDFSFGHFSQHVREAGGWLEIPTVAVPTSNWMQEMIKYDTLSAVKGFLELSKSLKGPIGSVLQTELTAHLAHQWGITNADY